MNNKSPSGLLLLRIFLITPKYDDFLHLPNHTILSIFIDLPV